MDYPEFMARFYDVLYREIRFGTDSEFYMEEIRKTTGPVLEVGVGTGRFFAEALKTGADMYGIDTSQNMLNVLLRKVPGKEHYRISRQCITDFILDKQFDLIIAPFRVFSHLLTVTEQLAALNHIAEKLTDQGRFIFDLFVPDLALLSRGLEGVTDFDGEYEPGRKLVRQTSMNTDPVNQRSNVSMKITWEEDNDTRSGSFDFSFRYFFRYEIEHLIGLSDLKLVTILGDFNRQALGPDSKEFIITCVKN